MDCIINEFPPLILFLLKQVNKEFYNTIKDEDIYRATIKEINKRLDAQFGQHIKEFKQVLEETGAVISGSFIIQCLLGEKWYFSDIDIYVPSLCESYNIHALNLTKLETYLINTHLYHHYYSMQDSYREVESPPIKSVSNFTPISNSIPIIQVIQINLNDTYPTIDTFIQLFDFDICKNSFHILNNKGIVKIGKLNQIMNKITTAIYSKSQREDERVCKYQTRGFEIK